MIYFAVFILLDFYLELAFHTHQARAGNGSRGWRLAVERQPAPVLPREAPNVFPSERDGQGSVGARESQHNEPCGGKSWQAPEEPH